MLIAVSGWMNHRQQPVIYYLREKRVLNFDDNQRRRLAAKAKALGRKAVSYATGRARLAGEADGLTRDDVLDNVTITWLTNTAISGVRLYWENKLTYFGVKGVSVPVAVSNFPDEIDLRPHG
jgi:hypothetical protein